MIGTVENYYVILQIDSQRRLWPEKKLIDYGPVDDRGPVLRWDNGNTLSVDLDKVYWVSSRPNKIGSVRIIYTYEMIDRAPY